MDFRFGRVDTVNDYSGSSYKKWPKSNPNRIRFKNPWRLVLISNPPNDHHQSSHLHDTWFTNTCSVPWCTTMYHGATRCTADNHGTLNNHQRPVVLFNCTCECILATNLRKEFLVLNQSRFLVYATLEDE